MREKQPPHGFPRSELWQAGDPIGVFDSGVGGLTVLHELLVALPQENFIYFGDTARFPYGERCEEELRCFAFEITRELINRGVRLIVVACNSATAAALPNLLEKYGPTPDVDIISVIYPEAQTAAVSTRSGRIGLLATPATVESKAYERQLANSDPHLRLVAIPCPDLAPIIQSGFPFDEEVVDTVRQYCQPLREADVDTVILGCTHYPLIQPMLQRMLGPDVQLITPGRAIARRVACALHHRNVSRIEKTEGRYDFICTGDPGAFRALGTRFLQMPVSNVERVKLEMLKEVAVLS